MSNKKLKSPSREREVEKYLVRECFKRKWDCWKLTSPNRRGVPDRMILADAGIMVMVECKSPTGRLSSLQARTIMKLQERGHILFVVSGYDQIDAVIRNIEEGVQRRKVAEAGRKAALDEAKRKSQTQKGTDEVSAETLPDTGN